MQLTLLKCKIHRATVTECDLNYEGSISIDENLLEQAGLLPYEQVDVLNISNGERLTTYVIQGERGSGIIGLNGAAARKAAIGDKVIIVAYCGLAAERAVAHKPVVLLMNSDNSIDKIV
jgi:aspartate 1-decarboxylase